MLSPCEGAGFRMHYDDHNPPHFHAIYSGHEARVGIAPVMVLEGDLPNRAASMVIEWAALHQQELMRNWERLRAQQTIERISPLE